MNDDGLELLPSAKAIHKRALALSRASKMVVEIADMLDRIRRSELGIKVQIYVTTYKDGRSFQQGLDILTEDALAETAKELITKKLGAAYRNYEEALKRAMNNDED